MHHAHDRAGRRRADASAGWRGRAGVLLGAVCAALVLPGPAASAAPAAYVLDTTVVSASCADFAVAGQATWTGGRVATVTMTFWLDAPSAERVLGADPGSGAVAWSHTYGDIRSSAEGGLYPISVQAQFRDRRGRLLASVSDALTCA